MAVFSGVVSFLWLNDILPVLFFNESSGVALSRISLSWSSVE